MPVSRYKMVAQSKVRGEVLTSFAKDFGSFKKAARAATQYSRMYGEATVRDQRAPTARGYLMICTSEANKVRRGPAHTPRQRHRLTVARCTLSSDAKALLKRKPKPKRRRRS
jgi:hypothetical protein